ncbi:MAG: Flp pilus assembly complex ATPase component TadA [Candidatus Ryanbacteria bacterium]|nr:Flp pilus assembly complex ATPase component TadA [Candidatus Ryanbacteria bacterium]
MRSIADLLVAKGAIDEALARRVKNDARASKKDIESVLLSYRVSEGDMLEAKSELLGIPTRSLGVEHVRYDTLKYISEESARHYQMIPLSIEEGVLNIGMVSPENLEAREALGFISAKLNMPFKIFLITRSDFNAALRGYEGLGTEVSAAMGELESVLREDTGEPVKKEGTTSETIVNIAEDAPITKMVAVILKHAVEGKASDVHIEPSQHQLRVRFRVDGVLYTSILLPMEVHDAVISRIKIMANLKIDEKRKPQDGRFRAHIDRRDIDFRVSSFPTYFGEKVVMRILDPNIGIKTLPELGLDGRDLEVVTEALRRPFGMILLTGPTGSGKSTTLYAMLKILNDEKRNIVSLEDPVEYYIEGLNQSQVRPEIEYTFASGLRSVLRQDPDIIMVGEIRDRETAQLAVHAALTGHLVLSTLHTNDSIGVIPRLIDMGVDPFLLPSTLVVAIAQRLTRTLCSESRKEIPVSGTVALRLESEVASMPEATRKNLTLPKSIYEALPSGTCPKGTRGRIGVFEALMMTPELEQIILKGPSESVILQEAKRQNMITMRQNGIIKVLEGKIGLEELFEVVV